MLNSMKGKKLLLILVFLSILAIADTAYLLYLHNNIDLTGFCAEGSAFDCNLVNQSSYAEFFGIPVALLGLIYYIAFFLITLLFYLGYDLRAMCKKIKRRHQYWVIIIIPLIGTLFALRLTYIETFILHAWCPFCLIQQVLVILMLIISIILLKKPR